MESLDIWKLDGLVLAHKECAREYSLQKMCIKHIRNS